MADSKNGNKTTRNSNRKICAFCGRPFSKLDRVFKSEYVTPTVFICNDCVSTCSELMVMEMLPEEDDAKVIASGASTAYKNLTPEKIKSKLDEYVIGQEEAKTTLSVAVYNHYKRLFSPLHTDVELQKSNVLLLGPSGSGKTLLAQTMARILDVPFAIADATTLTEAGYVGEDVENILLKLIQAADYDIKRAETGIIYVDEIDKIGRKTESVSITRDVSGEGVQQALLKIIEGTKASVPPQGGRKHPEGEMLQIDTTNILFIFGGAFIGMDEIVGKRTENATIGFGAHVGKSHKVKGNINDATPDDFVKFGLIPELIGRIPVIAALDAIDEDTMIRIMVEPKNSIVKQYKELLKMDGVTLEFENDALRAMAHAAIERKTGARSLRAVMEKTMRNVMFKVPSDKTIQKCIITKESIGGLDEPKLIRA